VPDPTPQQAFAEGMMQIAEAIKPMHEFLEGQVAYFASQGFTPQEALAMAAAEFVSIFGTMIPRDLPEGWGK
jgi:hypothetical protein